jgi:hypothetical protein
MNAAAHILLIIAFVSGCVFLIQSIYVLHAYEIESKKRPRSFQWWPFNTEMKAMYPNQSKYGRALIIVCISCTLLWLAYRYINNG